MSKSMYMFFMILYLDFLLVGAKQPLSRSRRHLVFPFATKFFIRLNIRENLFDYTTIFAQASGFKMSWNLPDKPFHKNKVSRRDLHEGLEELLDRHSIDGKACIENFLCESQLLDKSDVISQIASLIFPSDGEKRDCAIPSYCPLSLRHLTCLDVTC